MLLNIPGNQADLRLAGVLLGFAGVLLGLKTTNSVFSGCFMNFETFDQKEEYQK